MAYDRIRNPVSHREGRGFAFSWISIRYLRLTNLCAFGKITQRKKKLISQNFLLRQSSPIENLSEKLRKEMA